jgi:hypothetical protein
LVLLSNLIGNSTFCVALVGLSITSLKGGARIGTASSGAGTVGILGVRTSKLIHKVGNLLGKKTMWNYESTL